jgi:Domain of unknown function (DUF5060)
MLAKRPSEEHRQTPNPSCRPVGAPVWLSLAFLLLASCQPAAPTASAPSLEEGSPPAATLVPIPSTTPRKIASPPPGPLTIAPLDSDEIAQFGLLELEIQTDIVPSNPFDPEELDIRVEFTSESGTTAEVGAFWYQEFAKGGKPIGDPGWRARFTPTESGRWTAIARIPARGLQSEPIAFHVLSSDDPGFVRVHPRNPRYLAFDNGNFLFPIGLNMAWWTATGDALTDYQRWLDLFAANGGNTIRVWMAEWSFALEGNDTPLGNYTRRLSRAWMLDQVFAMAGERDVYVILVLLNCADYNDWQTNGWNGNPYNAARGGPLRSPEQFATDPTARALLQRKLNYIVNRWGYSTHLLAWEWWNEVNLTPIPDQALIPWLQEMTAYLQARDVNHHLTTNSYAIKDLSPIWQLPELDIIQKHEYADQVRAADRDLTERAAADFERLAASAPAKPILLGEFGYGPSDYGEGVERSGIHLHNGIWATTFVGYAGSGMYWWWDVYVEPNRLWSHFSSLSRFLTDVNLSEYRPFSPLEISGPDSGPGQAAGLGLRGDDVLIWLRSDAYTAQEALASWQNSGSPSVFTYHPPMVEGQVLTLRDMGEREYTIHWYDPQSGTWTDQVEAVAKGDRLSIPIPAFRRDLAAKIVPNR